MQACDKVDYKKNGWTKVKKLDYKTERVVET